VRQANIKFAQKLVEANTHRSGGCYDLFVRTCCEVWDGKLDHVRGDGAKLPTSKHHYTVKIPS
jgi:hypothetical protein